MLAYNPGVYDRSGEIIAEGANNAAMLQMEAMGNVGENIGSALVSLAGAYADNKAMDAKAKGYDQVGKILGDSMFKNNPAVGTYLSELRNVKNPMERIAGYETLFGMAGPMSNAMMAQGRFEQAPVIQTQRDNAATNRMYEAERLRREREAQAKIAAGQGTMTMPSNINADVIP